EVVKAARVDAAARRELWERRRGPPLEVFLEDAALRDDSRRRRRSYKLFGEHPADEVAWHDVGIYQHACGPSTVFGLELDAAVESYKGTHAVLAQHAVPLRAHEVKGVLGPPRDRYPEPTKFARHRAAAFGPLGVREIH